MARNVREVIALKLSCAVLILASVLLPGCTSVRPPDQPLSGFGGADYVTAQVRKQHVERNGASFFVFEPVASEKPLPRPAPLVIFVHGWECMNPAEYGAWLDHLARRGCVVVLPEFEPSRSAPMRLFTANLMDSVREAIAWLRERKDLSVELDRAVVVGHSAGGLLAVNYAVLAEQNGLPAAKAVFAVHPGNKWIRLGNNCITLEDMSRIPPETLLLILQGDADRLAMQRDGREIDANAVNVPRERKRLVVLYTDRHGRPKVASDHFACFARDNAYDADAITKGVEVSPADRKVEVGPASYLVYWRLLDALIAAPPGSSLKEALGEEPDALDLGRWSDGTPIRRLSER